MNLNNVEFGDIVRVSQKDNPEKSLFSVLIISKRTSKNFWVKGFDIKNQRIIDVYLPSLANYHFELIKGRE